MYIYIIIYYKYLFFSIFPRFILYPGIFCSPSVWNWWVLTKRVDARGNENSISLFPVCETKQKSGWIYPDMVHFPLLSNCPAEQNLFFPTFVSPNFRVSFFRLLKRIEKKKKEYRHTRKSCNESWPRERERKKEKTRKQPRNFQRSQNQRTSNTLQTVARSYHVEAGCDKEHMLPGILGEKSGRRIIEI